MVSPTESESRSRSAPLVDSNGHDIMLGLSSRPLTLPSKYFYDDRGSALFDAICDLPEYYLTRTELTLLNDVAATIAGITRAQELVELGAGTARKTHHLIEALLEQEGQLHYAALDISEYALEKAGESLTAAFPDLKVTGIQCDYTQTLEALDPDPGCLSVFLGSTIGNFSHKTGVEFLKRVSRRLADGDWLLLGVDLVKPVAIQEAAYNDSAGITAEFNKNILNVVNEETAGNFDPVDFRHLAFFNRDLSQIELYLVAKRDLEVRLETLGIELDIKAGERIRTEISRKFTRESTDKLLSDGGFGLEHWFESEDGYFGLALAAAAGK
ncbi:L-histidine N(alpha)-methyltransferase [Gemmatimonadota bacterium]